MTSSLEKIIESKRALRRQLATQPVAAKLRALEVLRERQTEIRKPSLATSRGAAR